MVGRLFRLTFSRRSESRASRAGMKERPREARERKRKSRGFWTARDGPERIPNSASCAANGESGIFCRESRECTIQESPHRQERKTRTLYAVVFEKSTSQLRTLYVRSIVQYLTTVQFSVELSKEVLYCLFICGFSEPEKCYSTYTVVNIVFVRLQLLLHL